LTRLAGGLLLASFVALGAAVAAAAQLGPPTQLLPQSLPAIAPPSPPAPVPPPINPGYAATTPNGLSPLLTQPGPVYELPAPASPSYPPQQLPGPIDRQKLQSYRNALKGQQWQLERQGVSPGSSQYSREIQQQLNQPDPQ
jgi:hypothetical protein